MKRILCFLVLMPSLCLAAVGDILSGASDYFGLGLSLTEMKGVGKINRVTADWNNLQPIHFGPTPYGFIGVDLSKVFGIELGFLSTKEEIKEIDFSGEDLSGGGFMGETAATGLTVSTMLRTHVALRHFYLTLRGYAPFWEYWRFFVEGGSSYEQNQLHMVMIEDRTVPPVDYVGFLIGVKESFIWRLGMGVEYMFNQKFGGRAAFLANGTSSLPVTIEKKVIGSHEVFKVKPFRDSYSLMTAFFVRF